MFWDHGFPGFSRNLLGRTLGGLIVLGNPLEERANPSCRDFLSERVCGRPHDQGHVDKDQGHAHRGIKTVAPAGKAEGKRIRKRKKKRKPCKK